MMFRLTNSATSRRLGGERGQAMVEFALVLPLLLVVLLGVLDFGKATNYWIDENHLAAEGARLVAVSGSNSAPPNLTCINGTSPSSLAQYIQCQADTRELLNGGTGQVAARAQVCITPLVGTDGTTGAVSDPIKVRVNVTYNLLPSLNHLLSLFSPLPGNPTLLPPISLAGSATMRLENAWTSGAVCYP
jgi:Flp pilus assembly protein TadG